MNQQNQWDSLKTLTAEDKLKLAQEAGNDDVKVYEKGLKEQLDKSKEHYMKGDVVGELLSYDMFKNDKWKILYGMKKTFDTEREAVQMAKKGISQVTPFR